MYKKQFDKLYSIFSVYSGFKHFEGCRCCFDKSEIKKITRIKLRDLTAKELSHYAESVFYTAGNLNDFKYYLPRILEICIDDLFDWPDPEVVLKKLHLADWTKWPKNEYFAVIEIIQRHFSEIISNDKYSEDDIDTWLCAIAHTGIDIAPFVTELIINCPDDKFSSFIMKNAIIFTKNKLSNAFWEDLKIVEASVVAALNCERARKIMSAKYGMKF